MSNLELTINSKGLERALANSPRILEKHVARAISRSVQEMARSAKRNAAKAFSTLTNAITATQPSPLEGLATAGTDYALAVEEGTDPGGSMPPVQHILDWIKVIKLEPRDPDMTQEDLAFVIARSIAFKKGTPAQPFMQPAFDDNVARAERRINKAINDALKEIAA